MPKPLIPVGDQPILLHLMKYYAHYGHTDFILCLGYRRDAIKEYFLNYNEALQNDFVLAEGGREVELLKRDIEDWRITFVDTGATSNIGERLRAVREHLEGEEYFLANYGDALTDAPLPDVIDRLEASGKVASLLCVKPTYTPTSSRATADGARSRRRRTMDDGSLWINGGFFIFRHDIFDYMHDGRGAGRGAVPAADRRAAADRRTATRASGRRWTRSRTRTLDALADTGRRRGPCGSRTPRTQSRRRARRRSA